MTRTIFGLHSALPPVPGPAGLDRGLDAAPPRAELSPRPKLPKNLSPPNIGELPHRAQHHRPSTTPRPRARAPSASHHGFLRQLQAQAQSQHALRGDGSGAHGPDLRPDTEFMWYWEEDGHRVKNHHTWDKQGNFIAYPPKVSTYLEQQWTTGQSADNLQITYKPFHSHTGFSYKVCFQDMNQINKGTGYKEKLCGARTRTTWPPSLPRNRSWRRPCPSRRAWAG